MRLEVNCLFKYFQWDHYLINSKPTFWSGFFWVFCPQTTPNTLKRNTIFDSYPAALISNCSQVQTEIFLPLNFGLLV